MPQQRLVPHGAAAFQELDIDSILAARMASLSGAGDASRVVARGRTMEKELFGRLSGQMQSTQRFRTYTVLPRQGATSAGPQNLLGGP